MNLAHVENQPGRTKPKMKNQTQKADKKYDLDHEKNSHKHTVCQRDKRVLQPDTNEEKN